MYNFIYVLTTLVNVALSALQLLLIARALLSWMPFDEDSKLICFITMLTEPVVLPLRLIFERFDALADLPIDISCMAAFLILSTVQVLLPTVRV